MLNNKNKVIHIPVLLQEVLDHLNIHKDMNYLDGTIGYGGHFNAIYEKANQTANFYGFDQDKVAYEYCLKRFKNKDNVFIFHDNFKNFKKYLSPELKFDAILLDIGISSLQIDIPERGFSYLYDAKLDMRMNQEQKLTAWTVINYASIKELTKIFKEYGECKKAYSVAKEIINYRKSKFIDTSFEFRDLINKIDQPINKKNVVKQYFQAIRIYVNDEINVLKSSIKDLANLLKPKGTLAIITFHSLEDKIVKNIFNELTTQDEIYKNLPIDQKIEFKLVNKKPIVPSEEEISKNKRAHSAKLRIIKKI